jgi:acyl-coenzyme A thioesterase PaaI-like protein
MNLLALWRKVSRLPNGPRIFSFLLGRRVPYTGSIGAVVRELEPGRAVVEMRDRRAVRNHLESIHAVALMNLAEVTSGLALIGGLPDSMRGIVTHFSIEYFKKARGKLTGRCECQIPESKEQKPYEIHVDVFNAEGEKVCRATARWLIGPKKARG